MREPVDLRQAKQSVGVQGWVARVHAADRFLANEIRAGEPEGRRVFHQNLRCVSRC